jgi:hypothetical protein
MPEESACQVHQGRAAAQALLDRLRTASVERCREFDY